LEEAAGSKQLPAGDTTAQHYLRLIEQQRIDDVRFPARRSGGYVMWT